MYNGESLRWVAYGEKAHPASAFRENFLTVSASLVLQECRSRCITSHDRHRMQPNCTGGGGCINDDRVLLSVTQFASICYATSCFLASC